MKTEADLIDMFAANILIYWLSIEWMQAVLLNKTTEQ